MYMFFNRPPVRFRGNFHFPRLPYFRRQIAQQMEDVVEFYRRHPKRVDADDVFGRLLHHIPLLAHLSDRDYFHAVDKIADGLIRAFGFTSAINRGKVFEGSVTLGKNSPEIVIATSDTNVSFNGSEPNWREWKPIQYLYHTRVDLKHPVPNNQSTVKGYGVLSVNIPLLAVQYRRWREWQKIRHRTDDIEQIETVYRFMGSVPYPNTIYSFFDIALFNRLSKIEKGLGLPKLSGEHPFYLTDFSRDLDQLCIDIIKVQEGQLNDIEQILAATPMIVNPSLWQTVQLPSDPINRNNEWALSIARLPYVRYLLHMGLRQPSLDRKHTNELHEMLTEARYDNIFSGVGSSHVVQHYREETQHLLDFLNQHRLGNA